MCSPNNRRANIDEAGNVTYGPCQNPKQKCKESEPKIDCVEFLDGDGKIVVGPGKQLVNLIRKDKWIDGVHVTQKDRLSRQPRILVRFDQIGKHPFRLKYSLTGPDYMPAEKGGNENFKYQDSEKQYTTGGCGFKIIKPDDKFSVHAAGKSKFKVEGTDNSDNTVQSKGEIETQRLVYYQEIRMKGVSPAADLNIFKQEFKKHGIMLVRASDDDLTIDDMENIRTKAEAETLLKNAASEFNKSDASKKKPHVIAIVYTGHLARMETDTFTAKNREVGPGKGPVEFLLERLDQDDPNEETRPRGLWKNVYHGNEEWFKSARCRVENIPKGACTPSTTNDANPHFYDKVSIDVSNLTAGTEDIRLTVNWAHFRMGLAFDRPGTPGPERKPVIAIATKSAWKSVGNGDLNKIMIHEMGHLIGMVSDGKPGKPEKVATWYEKKGHSGHHCYYNLGDKPKYGGSKQNRQDSQCVMYGAISEQTSAFCVNCAPAVKKMDLSKGWTKNIT